jgi:ribokinase
MARLLVIGAVALDRPIRLAAPAAPGARVPGVTLDGRLGGRLGGGGANAAVAWAAAGHAAMVASLVPDDKVGDTALELARAAGLDLSLVRRRPGPSGMTLILLDPSGERTVIGLDADRSARLPMATPDDLAGWAPDGVFIRSAYEGAEAWARATGGPVLLHWPSPAYRGEADMLVTSADDLDAAFLADPYGAARSVVGERLRWAVVTQGARGATAYGAEGQVTTPAPPAQVRDATGAGDAFAAGLLEAIVAGADIRAALAHACAWGAAAVALDSSAPLDAPAGTFRAS